MQIEDLDDDFEPREPSKQSTLVLVRKTKEDKDKEKRLVESLVHELSGIPERPPVKKMMFFEDQDAPQTHMIESAVSAVDEDVTFDDDDSVTDLLPSG